MTGEEILGVGLILAAASAAVLAFVMLFIVMRDEPMPVDLSQPDEDHDEDDAMQVWTAHWVILRAHYPFLPRRLHIEGDDPDLALRAIMDALFERTPYGFDEVGFPVPALPEVHRRRHFYLVGKSGSGKSTFMEHLIASDMKEGKGVAVISPEGEFFRDRLLHFVPEKRRDDLVYFAPSNPTSTITINPMHCEPGDNPLEVADELFVILLRTLGDDGLGPRMRPILQNALAALVGKPKTTLWDIKRMCEDEGFRTKMIVGADPYVREYWQKTFPKMPAGAANPIVYRLDRFLRSPTLRRVLCNPAPGLSIRQVLNENRIFFFDLFGLSESQRMLLGLLVLSKVQLELMAREVSSTNAGHVSLYCDEFQSFAGVSVALWRELLSRGRKYGLALTLANQYPNQLPTDLRNEIFGNVNSMASFVLGSRDASVVAKELLVDTEKKEGRWELEPVPMRTIANLKVGQAVVKLAGGRAIEAQMSPPLLVEERNAESFVEASWKTYGSPPIEATTPGEAEDQEDQEDHDVEAPEEPKKTKRTQTEEKEAPAAETLDAAPRTKPDPRPGRGGEEHKFLQALVKDIGEGAGFKASVEEQIDGGWADLVLENEARRIAVEIAVTSTASHELKNIAKCIEAGFEEVIVISRRLKLLRKLKESLLEGLRPFVTFLTPDEVTAHLAPEVETHEDEPRRVVAGYEVTTSHTKASPLDEKARQRALAEVLRRTRCSKKGTYE